MSPPEALHEEKPDHPTRDRQPGRHRLIAQQTLANVAQKPGGLSHRPRPSTMRAWPSSASLGDRAGIAASLNNVGFLSESPGATMQMLSSRARRA